jgi:hypothetical protein
VHGVVRHVELLELAQRGEGNGSEGRDAVAGKMKALKRGTRGEMSGKLHNVVVVEIKHAQVAEARHTFGNGLEIEARHVEVDKTDKRGEGQQGPVERIVTDMKTKQRRSARSKKRSRRKSIRRHIQMSKRAKTNKT